MSMINTTTQTHVRSTTLHMPAFVTKRMDAHHVDRIEQLMGGEHVHVWKRQGPGAVMLAGLPLCAIAGLLGGPVASLIMSPVLLGVRYVWWVAVIVARIS